MIFHSYVSLPEGNLSLYARSRLLLFFFETGGVPLLACYAGRTPGKFTGSYWLLCHRGHPRSRWAGEILQRKHVWLPEGNIDQLEIGYLKTATKHHQFPNWNDHLGYAPFSDSYIMKAPFCGCLWLVFWCFLMSSSQLLFQTITHNEPSSNSTVCYES